MRDVIQRIDERMHASVDFGAFDMWESFIKALLNMCQETWYMAATLNCGGKG